MSKEAPKESARNNENPLNSQSTSSLVNENPKKNSVETKMPVVNNTTGNNSSTENTGKTQKELSAEEAAILIQSHFRGFKTRNDLKIVNFLI